MGGRECDVHGLTAAAVASSTNTMVKLLSTGTTDFTTTLPHARRDTYTISPRRFAQEEKQAQAKERGEGRGEKGEEGKGKRGHDAQLVECVTSTAGPSARRSPRARTLHA